MKCELGKQNKWRRQVWYEECTSPVLHSLLQRLMLWGFTDGLKFGIVEFKELTVGLIGAACSSRRWGVVKSRCSGESIAVLGEQKPFSNWALRCPCGQINRSIETPVGVHVVALGWKPCVVSPQAVTIISAVDVTSLRWLWALKESGSQPSPRGGEESDFEALDHCVK